MMNANELYTLWKHEESIAHIHGWDFSHLDGRFSEDTDFPWDYKTVIHRYRRDHHRLLDYDTGGGEFLLSLNHPFRNTAATEGYAPNVALCKETLLPLGIDFRPCSTANRIPFPDAHFDLILNRHGDFHAGELFRLLKPGGVFITQQVGADNDRELVDMVLPDTPKPFPELYLSRQKQAFEDAGFRILAADEAHRPIRFYDVGAFVWFARIIQWEFPDFSVDRCMDRLLNLQRIIDEHGFIEGTTHRYLIVAQKP